MGTLTATTVSISGAQTNTAASASNLIPLTINQNDTTNIPSALVLNNAGTGNALKVVPTGNTGSTASSSGAIFLNNTSNTGIGLGIDTNIGNTGAAALLNVSSRNDAYTGQGLNIDYRGVSDCFIVTYRTASNQIPFQINDLSTSANNAAFYITSHRTGHLGEFVHTVSTNSGAPNLILSGTQTITGAVTDGYHDTIRLSPQYSATTAQTVTRHNYMDINDVTLSGTGPAALTDSAVMRFNAAAGTHKAVDGATTKTTPGTVNAWVKININGTIYYVPAYTSKTT